MVYTSIQTIFGSYFFDFEMSPCSTTSTTNSLNVYEIEKKVKEVKKKVKFQWVFFCNIVTYI